MKRLFISACSILAFTHLGCVELNALQEDLDLADDELSAEEERRQSEQERADLALLEEELTQFETGLESAPRAMAAQTLGVEIEDSPGYDSNRPDVKNIFKTTFCAEPRNSMSIENAAWLSFFAANEYSDPFLVAPMLIDLGFGNVGDNRHWKNCSEEMAEFERLENEGVITSPLDFNEFKKFPGRCSSDLSRCPPADWDSCSQDWFKSHYGDPSSGEPIPFEERLTPKFVEWFIKDTDMGSGIQFYSGGEFEIRDGAEGVSVIEAGSTQALWAKHIEEPTVVIAFRGTESNLKDYLVDIDVLKRDLTDVGFSEEWRGSRVHRGFLRAYNESGMSQLMERVRDPRNAGTNIWVTGHSLGGAVGTVFAAYLLKVIEDEDLNVNFKGLYTFGSPRVGNSTFTQRLREKAGSMTHINRFRNGKDTVTRVPRINYEHVGNLAHLNRVENPTLEYNLEIDEPLLSSFRDHKMLAYNKTATSLFDKIRDPDFLSHEDFDRYSHLLNFICE